jgi:hypothetical protein
MVLKLTLTFVTGLALLYWNLRQESDTKSCVGHQQLKLKKRDNVNSWTGWQELLSHLAMVNCVHMCSWFVALRTRMKVGVLRLMMLLSL